MSLLALPWTKCKDILITHVYMHIDGFRWSQFLCNTRDSHALSPSKYLIMVKKLKECSVCINLITYYH